MSGSGSGQETRDPDGRIVREPSPIRNRVVVEDGRIQGIETTETTSAENVRLDCGVIALDRRVSSTVTRTMWRGQVTQPVVRRVRSSRMSDMSRNRLRYGPQN